MTGDYKKLLNKNKKKKFADPKNMGVNIDKNEYYEIISYKGIVKWTLLLMNWKNLI